MADEEKNLNEENLEETPDLVKFETEDGETFSLQVERYFFYNGEEYVLLTDPEEDEDDDGNLGCYIMKVEPDEDSDSDEDEIFTPVEDEELLEKLLEIANNQYKEDTDLED